MSSALKFKIGDLVVRFGKVLKIFEIQSDAVKLKPYFQIKSNHGLTYSIPRENLASGYIRKPVSNEKLKLLLSVLKNSLPETENNVITTKVAFTTHKLADSLELIKALWLAKQAHDGFLPGGQMNLYQQALVQATEEIAAVKGIMPDEARLLVLTTLRQGRKPVLD